MANEGFKFTHDERRVLRDKLYDLVTKASMTPNEVIQTVEELLTKRKDKHESMPEDLANSNI